MTSHTPRLVIIGGGNMGTAIVSGLVANGWEASSITVVELDADKRSSLETTFRVRTSATVVAGEGALIAVKPGDAAAVCASAAALGIPRVLSIAAGTTTAAVRAMPNTPALVGEGVSAICGSEQCTEADLAWAESLLSAVGIVVRVDESHMDAVTAVAGSGPGYLFLIAESLLDAALAEGLPADIADALVRQLFKGAGALLAESTESPATLRERVTSPNGTTAAGLGVLEAAGIRETMHNVVKAAAARSVEMGK
jgi:pyrroline-5-carboxylate reductase